jgi:endonuclease/exonuclease/phosphatase family metal-dependent hydrolase
MSKLFFLHAFLLPFFLAGQSLTFMTYNIRYDNPGDGINKWPSRKAWLARQVDSVAPDILGIQEGLIHQVRYLDSLWKDYKYIGIGREDGKRKGEFSAIFYRQSAVKMLQQGTFWLSATPDQISTGWDAALERICTFGLFREKKSGKKFWVFNTHFDHRGVEARSNSAVLVLKKIKELNSEGWPVILMGDFNTTSDTEPIRLITGKFRDAKIADKSMTMGPEGTFNGFDPEKPSVERIDFIFAGYNAQPDSYWVIRESVNGRFPSDHYPVVSRITISY